MADLFGEFLKGQGVTDSPDTRASIYKGITGMGDYSGTPEQISKIMSALSGMQTAGSPDNTGGGVYMGSLPITDPNMGKRDTPLTVTNNVTPVANPQTQTQINAGANYGLPLAPPEEDFSKYASNYKAEIDRRTALLANDPNNVALKASIAELTNLRNAKISTMTPAQLAAAGIDKYGNPIVKSPVVGATSGVAVASSTTSVPIVTGGTSSASFDYTSLLSGLYDRILSNGQSGFSFQPFETSGDYLNRMAGYINSTLDQRLAEQMAGITKARGTIGVDAAKAQRDMELAYQKQINDLEVQAQKIQAAYEKAMRDIDEEKKQTMPEFQSQRVQSDVGMQKTLKSIQDAFARRGLSAGGQVMSEMAGTYNQGLSSQSAINTAESTYLRTMSNKVADVASEQAIDLADVNLSKIESMAELTNKQADIIESVQNALMGLSLDETNIVNDIAIARANQLSELPSKYDDKYLDQYNTAFGQWLQSVGVQNENTAMLIEVADKINEAKEIAKDAEVKNFVDTISQFAGNYQKEIDRIEANMEAGDNSEEWKLPYLKAARQDKIANISQEEKDRFLATINQYSANYQKEINRIETAIKNGDSSEKWKLDYLKAARQEKIDAINAEQAAIAAARSAAVTQAAKDEYEAALTRFKTLGVMPNTTQGKRDSATLGIAVGSKTADYIIDLAKIAISNKNASTAAKNAETAASKKDESPASNVTFSQWVTQIKDKFTKTTTDATTKEKVKVFDYQGAMDYILGLEGELTETMFNSLKLYFAS